MVTCSLFKYFSCGKWTDLAELKNPSIGYLPFVEACVEEKQFVEAVKYIKFLKDPADQMEWLCNIGYYRDAAEIAWSLKDKDALLNIKSLSKNPSVNNWIDSLLSTKVK